MGLHKTVSDLEEAGYSVRTFVLPAVSVGAWHERKRVFAVGHKNHVSDTSCKHREDGAFPCTAWKEEGWYGKETEFHGKDVVAGSGNGCPVQFGGNGADGNKNRSTKNRGAETVIYRAYQSGYENLQVKSRMGGVADGLSAWMDGHRLWKEEPERIGRVAKKEQDWGNRMLSLGNAVVPQQVYPVLKYIAEIETGRCRKECIYRLGQDRNNDTGGNGYGN